MAMTKSELKELLNKYKGIHQQYEYEFKANDGVIDSNEQELLDGIAFKIKQLEAAFEENASAATKSGAIVHAEVISLVPHEKYGAIMIINLSEDSGVEVKDKVAITGSPYVGYIRELYKFRAQVIIPSISCDDIPGIRRVKITTGAKLTYGRAEAFNEKRKKKTEEEPIVEEVIEPIAVVEEEPAEEFDDVNGFEADEDNTKAIIKSLKKKGIDPDYQEKYRDIAIRQIKTLTKEDKMVNKSILVIFRLYESYNSDSKWGQKIDLNDLIEIRNLFIDGQSTKHRLLAVAKVMKYLVTAFNSSKNAYMHTDLTEEEKAYITD